MMPFRANNRGMPPRGLMYSVGTAVLLFLGTQFGLIYRDYITFNEQKMTFEAEIQTLERRLTQQKMQIMTKERDIHRLERRLSELESKYRSKMQDVAGRKDFGGLAEAKQEPTIYIITPTQARPAQKADLTRLSHTFMLLSNIHWIVVEDGSETSYLVENVLKRSKVRYSLLSASTPLEYKLNESQPTWLKPKGVAQRNAGLQWLRTNLHINAKGVVYFADDDNAYDLRLFDEVKGLRILFGEPTIRTTVKVSVWPVGLAGGLMVERPLVNNSRVVGWIAGWKVNRPYPIDMAGFAVNLNLILHNVGAMFSYEVQRGYQESHFLQSLIDSKDALEPKADSCTKVYVWHTRTEKTKLKAENLLISKGLKNSNDGIEV